MNVSKAHRIIVTLKDITVSTHMEVTTVSVNQKLSFVHKLVGFNHFVSLKASYIVNDVKMLCTLLDS